MSDFDFGKAVKAVVDPVGSIMSFFGGSSEAQAAKAQAADSKEVQKISDEAAMERLLTQFQYQGIEATLARSAALKILRIEQDYGSKEAAKEYERILTREGQGRQFEAGEAEAEFNRIVQREESGRKFEAGESEKAGERVLTREDLARKFQSEEAEKTHGRDVDILGSQQQFTAVESEKGRTQQEKLQEKQLGLTKEMFDVRKSAYDKALQRADPAASAAEAEFQKETAPGQSPEMAQVLADTRAGTSEDINAARNRARSEYAMAGVRGAQRATNVNRATGQAQKDSIRDINKMTFEEAQKKRDARTQYQAGKATRAGQTLTTAGTF